MSTANGERPLRVGIDFDNTLVCYDALFARLAEERGLLRPTGANGEAGGATAGPSSKRAIRDRLRAAGREAAWTELQAVAYGPRIGEAVPFPGARDFLSDCASRGIDVFIVSHKTRLPYAEPRTDLRAAALGWLRRYEIVGKGAVLPADRVFFESTRAAKIARIAELGCTCFVDDLVEFLAEPGLPHDLLRILFEPSGPVMSAGDDDDFPDCVRAESWEEIAAIVLGASVASRHG